MHFKTKDQPMDFKYLYYVCVIFRIYRHFDENYSIHQIRHTFCRPLFARVLADNNKIIRNCRILFSDAIKSTLLLAIMWYTMSLYVNK